MAVINFIADFNISFFYSGNNTYCMHDHLYHGRCMHHNYRIPIPVIPVRYSQLPGENVIKNGEIDIKNIFDILF